MSNRITQNVVQLKIFKQHLLKQRWPAYGVAFFAAGISTLVYHPVLYRFFVQDDFWFLQAVQKPWPNQFLLGGVLPDYWRPVSTYWFHWINVKLFGLDVFAHRAVLLGVFGVTVFVWGLATYEITGSYLGEFLGASLYGLARLHLFTLGWVSGAIDILAALFLAITLFCLWRRERCPVIVLGISFGLGVLSKEPVILVVFLVVFSSVLIAKLQKRRLTAWEKRINFLFFGLLIGYATGWICHTAGQLAGGEIGFYWQRVFYVLGNAIAAVIPDLDYQNFPPWQWFLLPVIGVGIILIFTPKENLAGLFWGLGLYVFPALPFSMFDQPFLQPYYGHFSLFGLSLLLALAVSAFIQRLNRPFWRKLFAIIFAAGMFSYLFFAWQTIDVGISQSQSPALFEVQHSEAAFDAIHRFCIPEQGCNKVVFLDVSETMWWAMGKGVLVSVMFPGVSADFDGYAGYQAQENIFTHDNLLVLRQVDEMDFEVVEWHE